jgi:hypothetical protein
MYQLGTVKNEGNIEWEANKRRSRRDLAENGA